MAKKQLTHLEVETLRHDEATRKNIPTAEHQSVMERKEQCPIRVAYEHRNRDLDPQLVWRGKDEQDWSDLVVQAPPLYIQEKVHPKVLIDDLLRRSKADAKAADTQCDLFADFNGLPSEDARTEFYQHEAHWSNRMILGDGLQVMASLAEREGLRGTVQCIYIDPPYGIKFNSNFQWSTTSRDVKDGNTEHITREPEQVKAFRDTWREGIHSYLTYLRDRLTVARDLLTDSGSIFVQIGDENVHRVRALMDEIFGDENFVSQISFVTTTSQTSRYLSPVYDIILWFSKTPNSAKYRSLFSKKDYEIQANSAFALFENDCVISKGRTNLSTEKLLVYDNLTSRSGGESSKKPFKQFGRDFLPTSGGWKTSMNGLATLGFANRIGLRGNGVYYVRYFDDFPVAPINNLWRDTQSGGMGKETKQYVVQTNESVIQRCILMVTDPGDLVLDPTCGSGTTAYVAEQWGRRWITIDTSRVALALARARIMGARYPYYILADSLDGQLKEAEISGLAPSSQPTRGDIRHGFVFERVPHITLKSIANNAEIDVIWEKYQQLLEPLREKLNGVLVKNWQEWEIPREVGNSWQKDAIELHAAWWEQRIARQQEIDASITAKAEFEYLYDKPYVDKKKVRVAGPFTVESISPHRVLGVDENDELIDNFRESTQSSGDEQGFVQMILNNLSNSGVQQAHKEDKITFSGALMPWPGDLICAEGRYIEGYGMTEKRAAIFIGPEFGTVSRPDLVSAAREAGDAGFDVLITCAFNYDAHSSEFNKLGRIPVLKARMNADLHMAGDLKNTGKGNLFVIFGEPDIDILDVDNGQIKVKVNGVDVFHPNTGEVRSDGAEGIACWFIDTDYNMESFFVRHAYFLGANDPYKALKTTLRAEINDDAWASLNSDTSRPFDKPETGRIAVKVINHLGDEVMKVFKVF
jgi:adenine-specific DNA-methyltransferase